MNLLIGWLFPYRICLTSPSPRPGPKPYYKTYSPDRGKAKDPRNPMILSLISSFLVPRPLARTKGQRNTPSFVTWLNDSPGVCSPSGTHWMRWTITPPKYWPNSVSQPWLGGGKMNELFDDCYHWKWGCVIVRWSRRACNSHLATWALSYQPLGAAFKPLLEILVFFHFPAQDLVVKGLHS